MQESTAHKVVMKLKVKDPSGIWLLEEIRGSFRIFFFSLFMTHLDAGNLSRWYFRFDASGAFGGWRRTTNLKFAANSPNNFESPANAQCFSL